VCRISLFRGAEKSGKTRHQVGPRFVTNIKRKVTDRGEISPKPGRKRAEKVTVRNGRLFGNDITGAEASWEADVSLQRKGED